MNLELLQNINKINVLVFGDFMVDEYLIGNVNRISPEAPVPVIEVINDNKKLGGAGNVINNIRSLGANVRVIGTVGKDSAGDFIIDTFKEKNVDVKYFKQYTECRTIIKTRVVSRGQQFLRLDEEDKKEMPEKYMSFLENKIDSILDGITSVVISDYAKGAVNKRIAQLLIKNANKLNIPVIVDPKGNDYSKYKGTTLCTPNLKELSDVSNKRIITEEDVLEESYKLCHKFNIKYLALTRSEDGISLIDEKKNMSDFKAVAKEVIDVSGAGDTVVSTMAILISMNMDINEICKIANIAAGIVVSKFGTATVSSNELISEISKDSDYKLQSVKTLKYIIKDLKEKGKKVVFTNGCFDLIHVGHISSFKEAKKFGDVLIVAVNSDASVKSNKGDLRPIINQKDRIEMVSSLEMVDYVVLLEDKNPSKLIKELQPDISVKGEDWKNKEVPEKKILESYGGEIKFIKLNPNHSTTSIIEKILKVYEK